MRRANTFLDLFLLILAIILVVTAAVWYPALPDRSVIHMNGAGQPDGWAERNPITWSLLPGLGLLLALVLRSVGRWMEGSAAKNPKGFNMPDQKRFMALSEEDRRTALTPTATYLRYTAMMILVLFTYIIEGLGRLSTEHADAWPAWPVFFLVMLIIAGIPWLIRRTRRAILEAPSGHQTHT